MDAKLFQIFCNSGPILHTFLMTQSLSLVVIMTDRRDSDLSTLMQVFSVLHRFK
jgi:hypothetical protein